MEAVRVEHQELITIAITGKEKSALEEALRRSLAKAENSNSGLVLSEYQFNLLDELMTIFGNSTGE